MILDALIIAISVLFIHACFWPGMILGFISDATNWFPEFIRKPIYECVICMTPWWGTIICILFSDQLSINSFQDFILTIICAAGLNTIADKYIGPIHKYER